jgi:hypothetical protein
MPSWVNFDNSASKIRGTAPLFEENTDYTFYVESKWTDTLSVTVKKSITIQVKIFEATAAGVVAAASAQGALAAGVGFTMASSLMSNNSPTAIWSLVNQLQMITLLMLTDSFTPEDFISYQEGTSFINLNFDFIPVYNVPYVNWPAVKLDTKLDDRKLNASGMNSQSTFVNLFSTIVMLLIAI